MDNNQTVEKLRQMRLKAMASYHLQNIANNRLSDTTPDEYLAMITDHEWEHRQNNKIARFTYQAGFRQEASIESINYTALRNLDKNMFQRLANLSFIQKKENIIITGASGVGKSYIAQALGRQACLLGHRVIYGTTSRLMSQMKLSKVDGTYLKELKKLSNIDVLIMDDFGLQAFDNSAREALMDIIDDRYQKTSTILCSQIPVAAWYDIIGEGTIADAILDRIVHSSHRIDLKGASLRKELNPAE